MTCVVSHCSRRPTTVICHILGVLYSLKHVHIESYLSINAICETLRVTCKWKCDWRPPDYQPHLSGIECLV